MPEQFFRPSFNRVLVNGQWVDIPEELMPAPSVNPNIDQLFAGAMPWAQPVTSPTLLDMIARAPNATGEPAQTPAPEQSWGDMAVGMGLRTVPAVAGAALGGPVGAFVGGALGEAAGEWYEGRPINPWQVGVQGALNLIPGAAARGPVTQLGLGAVEQGVESALANNALSAIGREAAQGALLAPPSTVASNWAEGRPLTENMGMSTALGAAFGGGTGAAMQGIEAAAPVAARGAERVRETVGDMLSESPTLASALLDQTGAVGNLNAKDLPPSLRGLRAALPEKQWKTLVTAATRVPEARKPLSFLLPAEIEPLTRSAGALARFAETYQRLPDADFLVAAIRRGAPKRGWYENSRRALRELFGDDADQFTGVLAAMSPQTSVESNLINALNTYVNWRAAGRPTDAAAIKAIINRSVQGGSEASALDAWVDNTVRVLQGGQSISGPKIDQFWLALRDRALRNRLGGVEPTEAMVLDAWMGNLMGADQTWWSGNLSKANREQRLAQGDPGVTPYYLAGVARMREAAKKAGVTGAEAQEMAWSTAMALYERASELGISAREVLERGLLDDAHVAGTPDFSSLLRQDTFASILQRDPELGARLSRLAELPHTAGDPVAMTPRNTRDLGRVAGTLDSLRSMRRADTAVETAERPAGQLAAVVPMEAATDAQWSSLLPYAPENEADIARLSPQVFDATENMREQNTLLDILMQQRSSARAKGVGSWKDDLGRLQENPSATYGVPVNVGRDNGVVPSEERRIRAARDVAAMATGQSAAAHVVINPNTPRAQHNALAIYAGRIIKDDQMKAFAADLRALDPQYVPIHAGRSVRILRVDNNGAPVLISEADEAALQALASRYLSAENAKGKAVPPKFETGVNVAKDGYKDIARGAEPGSGQRVRNAVGAGSDWAKLSPGEQRKLDAQARTMAARLLKVYDMKRVASERPDEARMLQELADGGVTGLLKSLGGGAVLPALALLGLSLGDDTQETR